MSPDEGIRNFRTGIAMEKIRDILKRETLPKFEIEGKPYSGIYYCCWNCRTRSVGVPGVAIWICNNCGVKHHER